MCVPRQENLPGSMRHPTDQFLFAGNLIMALNWIRRLFSPCQPLTSHAKRKSQRARWSTFRPMVEVLEADSRGDDYVDHSGPRPDRFPQFFAGSHPFHEPRIEFQR